MATTMFFGQELQDQGKPELWTKLEFGRSSFYRENLIYFVVDGKTLIVDEKTGRAICEAMQTLGTYLGYD